MGGLKQLYASAPILWPGERALVGTCSGETHPENPGTHLMSGQSSSSRQMIMAAVRNPWSVKLEIMYLSS